MKHILHLKHSLALAALAIFMLMPGLGRGQTLLLNENFDYPLGDSITAHGWVAHSGGTTNTIKTMTKAITYRGYLSSGIGNEVSLASSGQDDHKTFTSQATGNVYASFLVKITTAADTGDYFFHLGPAIMGTDYKARVFVKTDGGTRLAFGITHTGGVSNPVIYSSFISSLNNIFLIVLKYTFVPGNANDVVSLFINPALGSVEPSATLVATDVAQIDPEDIGSVALRQGTATTSPTLKLDGIRVGTTWNDVAEADTTTFTGTGNWSTASNWSNGIPTSSFNTIIDGIATIDVPAKINDLTINTGKSITISGTKFLIVKGDLANSAGPGGLVVKSGGALIQNSGGVSATVERDVNAWTDSLHGWHLLSAPISSQAIQPNFVPDPPTANEAFYAWDEPTGLWINSQLTDMTWNPAFEANFSVGKGYLCAYRTPGTKQFTGTLNNADTPLSFTRTEATGYSGWNLLGNPFPSALVWNDGYNWIVPSTFAAIAKVWDEGDAAYYDIYPTKLIPALNGFMVQVLSGSPAMLTIPIAARLHYGDPVYMSSEGSLMLIAYDLENSIAQESIIRVNGNATDGYDSQYDSHFLAGYAPLFYSIADGEQLSTNTLPAIDNSRVIPIGFVKNAASNFSIVMENSLFFGTSTIYLTDLKTDSITNMSTNPVYNFTSVAGDDANRFLLSFQGTASIANPDITKDFRVHAENGVITILQTGNLSGKVTVTDMAGRTLATASLKAGSPARINLQGHPGVYVVSIVSTIGVSNVKVIVY